MEGWIRVWRKILDNPLWSEKPFSKGQAWIDLILLANHKDNQLLLGNSVVTIRRGQLHTSELNLSRRWGWSRKKTRAFLSLLDNQKMATTKGTSKGTTITIANYSDYQDFGTSEDTAEGTAQEHQKNIKRTSKDTQTKNVKNVMNGRNEKKENKDIYSELENFSFSESVSEAIKDWIAYKEERRDGYKPTGFKTLLKGLKEKSELYGDNAVIDSIKASIESNYKGLFWTNAEKAKTSDQKSRYRGDDFENGWDDVL